MYIYIYIYIFIFVYIYIYTDGLYTHPIVYFSASFWVARQTTSAFRKPDGFPDFSFQELRPSIQGTGVPLAFRFKTA